jgi:hypothetical protein
MLSKTLVGNKGPSLLPSLSSPLLTLYRVEELSQQVEQMSARCQEMEEVRIPLALLMTSLSLSHTHTLSLSVSVSD